MKRCYYCAELIQDEAIFCRYCRRDLPSEGIRDKGEKIGAIQDSLNKWPQTRGMIMPEVELDDLLSAWAESYDNIPEMLKEAWSDAVDPIAREWMVSIVEQWIAHKIAPDAVIEQKIYSLTALCYQWAIISSAIGIEAGKSQIPEGNVPQYLYACVMPLKLLLAGYLDALEQMNWIKPKKTDELMVELDELMREQSVRLANLGILLHSEVSAKYHGDETSPLSRALAKINIRDIQGEKYE